MATTIYTLSDPRSGEIRYVGKTQQRDAVKRLDQHVCRAKSGRRYVCKWIRSLGGRPLFKPLLLVENSVGAEVERKVIALFRCQGYRLTNLTDGGEGTSGYRFTEEQRARVSAVQEGKPGHPVSEEAKAKISVANKGKKRTAEMLAKLSEARRLIGPKRVRGKGLRMGENSPEGRARQRAAVQGNQFAAGHPRTPEHTARAAAGRRRGAAIRRDGLLIGLNWEAFTLTRNERRALAA